MTPKRKMGHDDDHDETLFNINDYNFKSLDDLIFFIEEYQSKKLPSKKIGYIILLNYNFCQIY